MGENIVYKWGSLEIKIKLTIPISHKKTSTS
ncbi:Hypothetical Protein SLY_0667 [Strawberry lethal yellows phytoplasma (CPA) str. NZSb11]|uniref:Uncharacterized protein n=1 Tax=Strawberry lethal yellows phytoplasma (CPA) str. NZSb11 TaxID=980422 RepID=R4RXG4_PHYAS|nr:Hypothetical Protein SLY_0667 [Strawberry lethal yellows phytoplasma (CPA) str. NZSb11]